MDWTVGSRDYAFQDILIMDGTRAPPTYNHRYLGGDLLVAVQPPNPQFYAYSVLDRPWAISHLPQTIYRLQIRTICSATAKVFVVASVVPISLLAPAFPDMLFNNPGDMFLVPFTTSMDKIVAIGGCTYYDTSFIDVGHAISVPVFHSLCIQVLFSSPAMGQTARITVTYSMK
jgi:hypothetical protein